MSTKHRQRHAPYTYSLLDMLAASPDDPMPATTRESQLRRMWVALAALERDPSPTPTDWRLCSDAVNLMETLIEMGVCADASGLLKDAVTALAIAGARSLNGSAPIRLSGPGMLAVRAVLEDYAEVLEAIPHRTAIEAHRRTERRIREIHSGKRRPHDVEIPAL